MSQIVDSQQTSESIKSGIRVLRDEAAAISRLADSISLDYDAVVQAILACQGRIIVTGIGKSGHIARKIAATFASTGTPAYFVHPAEAQHGDLGMIADDDLVIALSKSGSTAELMNLVPILKRRKIKLCALSCNAQSQLASLADLHIDLLVKDEACPLNLAPTSSTTVTLAIGDALAVSVLLARGFKAEDFALSHPGGNLGKRLLLTINDVMQQGDKLPVVNADTPVTQAILEISAKCLGMTTVVTADNPTKVIGICTDGDLRRAFADKLELNTTQVADIMSKTFVSIKPQSLAIEALQLMQENKISALPVIDKEENLVGALNMHSLFAAGLI